MRMGEAGADTHFPQETFDGVGIVARGGSQRPQTFHPLREGILDAVLHRAAGTSHDIKKLVPGVSLPEFELHPTGLLAGSAPRGGGATPATSFRHLGRAKSTLCP